MSTSFSSFAQARLTSLRRFGFMLTGNSDDGDDLVQAALLRVASRWPAMRHHDAPEAYVRQTMVRLNLNRLRQHRRQRTTPGLDQDVLAETVDLDLRRALIVELAKLPARQRTVIVLRYYEGLSEAEIAAAMRCSTGTVKSQAAKALASLRRATEHGNTLLPGGTP